MERLLSFVAQRPVASHLPGRNLTVVSVTSATYRFVSSMARKVIEVTADKWKCSNEAVGKQTVIGRLTSIGQ